MPFIRRLLTGATLAGAVLLSASPVLVHAQAFPSQTIRIIVPYPAGGTS
jgi:tripartite-type tricarboxylate transporter receptor subunit TctC